ncbi:cation diffusion facilitator family transporter [uncultured Merdimonas sp.]|uniref:cation diffusion facilitator family transporter n=1 Tax=uncultured Merdimonas sp. TaxID=2023269 RepID=UPI00320ACB78
MTDFLVKKFVKDYEEVEKVSVRTAYGVLASVTGIFCNVLLFLVKGSIGMFLHSLSVTADAFNNLSDAGSSVVGLVGVKMAEKPADREHPFGHGRLEYIAALVVAFLVLEIGFTFFKEAVGKILDPQEMKFQMLSVAILILSIGVKLWMAYFNRKLGKRIDSKVMLATATDAMGDVITTSATIASLLVFHFTGQNVDGVVGLLVSLVVMWAGVGIARDTLEPLLGEAVTPEEYDRISRFVESYDGVVGSHDLIVHNYGPGRSMASIHAEVPNDVDVEISHEIIDRIEREAAKKLGIFLVIHMDPVETRDAKVLEVRQKVVQILEALDPAVSIHDFRMVSGKEQNNLIFDMVVPFEYDEKKQEDLKRSVSSLLKLTGENYQCVITVERSYIGK